MYDLGLLTSTKVSFERVQTCTIHTSFSIFNCGWCCNGHKWWALHDQRHLKCVGTRPEGPCPLHNFVPTIDHIHVEICTKKLFQAAMIFFLAWGRPLSGVISRPLHGQLVTYPPPKKFRLQRPRWGWPLLTKNSCYRGEWIVWSGIKKHDIVTQRVHTNIHFTKLLFTGEEFMVLENIIGEKFMIPWKNIHPWPEVGPEGGVRKCT